MDRVFHPYTDWEEFHAGMWRSVFGKDRSKFLKKAVKFTGDHNLYGSYMLQVLKKWPISCEHNLSDVRQNRKAWIGHAACCLAFKCPEDITREAWGLLTEKQRDLANGMAEEAIEKWENENKDFKIFVQMAIPGLSAWDTRRSLS